MISAEELKIHVVSEDVLDGFPEESITALIKRKTISEWGSNVRLRTTTKLEYVSRALRLQLNLFRM